MSAHILLNLLNELKKKDEMYGFAEHYFCFFTMSLINSIIQEHNC